MSLKKIEMRKAVPKDLKLSRNRLKIGLPYAIVEEGEEKASGVFVLQGDEDPFVLKMYLERGQIYIPVVDKSLKEFLKPIEDDIQSN